MPSGSGRRLPGACSTDWSCSFPQPSTAPEETMLFPISLTQFLCEEGSVIITVALVIGSSLPCQLLEGSDGVCFAPFDPQNLVSGQECQTAVVLVGLTLNSWLNGKHR